MAGGATAEPGRTATLHGRASTSSARSTDRLPRVLSTTPRRPCRGSSHVSDASPPATACLRHAPPPCRRDAPAVGARHAGGRPQRGAHLDLTLCQAPGFWRREREPAASVAYRASPRCGTRHASTTWGAGRNPSAASPRGAASWPPRPLRLSARPVRDGALRWQCTRALVRGRWCVTGGWPAQPPRRLKRMRTPRQKPSIGRAGREGGAPTLPSEQHQTCRGGGCAQYVHRGGRQSVRRLTGILRRQTTVHNNQSVGTATWTGRIIYKEHRGASCVEKGLSSSHSRGAPRSPVRIVQTRCSGMWALNDDAAELGRCAPERALPHPCGAMHLHAMLSRLSGG